MSVASPLPSLLVIPTGIGCEIGGYAGDGIPTARLLAAASGCLITHPNVMNGASLFWNDSRIQYVEGFSLDQFACGEILLRPSRSQKIGVILDKGLGPELRYRHLQVVDGCRATLGLDIGPVIITDHPIEISFDVAASGASWGELLTPELLLRAGEQLKKEGVTAIAIVTRFSDDFMEKELDDYRKGRGVDVMAGAEAIISHLLVKHLGLPCAHSPAFEALPIEKYLDPRAAGEELGHTFLPCVLVGLSRAPDLIPREVLKTICNPDAMGLIGSEQLGAVVAPEGALGGAAVLGCIEQGIPLIVVSNPGVLNVDLKSLEITSKFENISQMKVFTANNYFEAAALILALREGLAINSLKRPIQMMMEHKPLS